MKIEEAQYVEDTNTTIKAKVNGEDMFIPCNSDNRHYAEAQRQVNAGTLTIEEAD